jgi:hypothetical protein
VAAAAELWAAVVAGAAAAAEGDKGLAMTTTFRIRLALIALLSAGILLLAPAADAQQRRFASAEEAGAALKEAIIKDDVPALLDIFGKDQEDIIVGVDPQLARIERRRAAELAKQKLWVVPDNDNRAVVAVGHMGWTLPFPLVRQDGQWAFDTEAGRDEILARRVGRNELSAIATLKALVTAQHAYAARLRSAGKPAQFARYVQSSPGKTDGLWWNAATERSEGPSPLAKYVNTEREFVVGRRPGDPYRGYYYRILTSQGEHAPKGAMSYMPNGALTRGFAIIAWPADYGVTGVMTFMVSDNGRILEKDLGEETASLVQSIRAYDPDESWKKAQTVALR